MAKLLFFDLETTGTDCNKHAIHQLSGLIEIDGNVRKRFDFKVKPHKEAIIDNKALEVAGITEADLANYHAPSHIYLEFTKMLSKYVDKFNKRDKFYLVGYNNAGFDNGFLRNFFMLQRDQYFGSWFWSCPIDVMILAGYYLLEVRPSMPDFKQSTVAMKLGIDIDETRLHDAEYDIDLCRKIYNRVRL